MKRKIDIIDTPTPKEQVESDDVYFTARGWFEVACKNKLCLNNKENTCLIPCLIELNEMGICNKIWLKKIKPLVEPLIIEPPIEKT